MVSVADEQGRLVLMGVDATYCVVDEVDTTASTLHDHYLQQVITCKGFCAWVHLSLASLNKMSNLVFYTQSTSMVISGRSLNKKSNGNL